MNTSDEIKSRLDIVDVIKEYLELKPAGANFSAFSPFTRESNPSFMVSPDKQIWHCFSTDKGGDIFTFVMEIEGVDFKEALRILAPKAGVELKRQNPEQASRRAKMLDITRVAVNYYHKYLLDATEAKPVRKYLYDERGLSEDTIMEWEIGFSPDSWDDLVDILRKRGYKDDEMVAAGLANRKEGTSRIYNRFRNRVMFPINDVNSNPVAFSARVRPDKEAEEKMGKYINSPQTQIYNKSGVVFGLDKAKLHIKNNDSAVIVEGQMDAITAYQNGFKNTVASSGTALTPDQLRLIKRYSKNIILAFDMDSAGRMAAERGVKAAMAMDMAVKVISAEEGSDPDEIIRREPGKWTELTKKANHFMDHYFNQVFGELDISDIDGKRRASEIILPVIAYFKNSIDRSHWIRKLSEMLDIDESYLMEAMPNPGEEERGRVPADEGEEEGVAVPRASRFEKMSEYFLVLLLKFPQHLNDFLEKMDYEYFSNRKYKLFYKNIILYYNKNSFLDYSGFRDFIESQKFFDSHDNDEQLRLLEKLSLAGEKDVVNMEEAKALKELSKIFYELKKEFIFRRIKELEKVMEEAEQDGDAKKVDEFMAEIQDLLQELSTKN